MWYNAPMSWLLRSPLHPLISKNIMLMSYAGRKSGKKFTTPVNYTRTGNKLTVISFRHRNWWRNLRGGAQLGVLVKGREFAATGQVIEDKETVARELAIYLKALPQAAKYMHVSFGANGEPNPAEIAGAAEERVVISITIA